MYDVWVCVIMVCVPSLGDRDDTSESRLMIMSRSENCFLI